MSTRPYISRKPYKNSPQLDEVFKKQRRTLIEPSNIEAILTLMRPANRIDPISLEELALFKQKGSHRGAGHWLVRAASDKDTDEYGWLCIHWPTLLHSIPLHHAVAPYLKSLGADVAALRLRPMHELEEAYTQITGFKRSLLRTLPPGSVLEADNPFFQTLAEIGKSTPHDDHEDDPITAHLHMWTVIRFGALSSPQSKSFESTCLAYGGLGPSSICGIDRDLLERCPDVVRVLAAVLIEAVASGGKGWQKWGIAWTRAGLVFNYQIALNSLAAYEPAIFRSIFPDRDASPAAICGEWFSGSFMTTPIRVIGLPYLGKVARIDESVGNYIRKTMVPYKALFQDRDPDIAANYPYHNSDMQIFFPVSDLNPKKDPSNIIEYFRTLVRLSQRRQAEIHFQATGQESLHYVKRNVVLETRLPTPTDAKEEPRSERKNKFYRVAFNAFNLGSMEQPENPLIRELPYRMTLTQYTNRYFFSYPDQLTEVLPVLKDRRLYKFKDKPSVQHTFQWQQTPYGWYAKKLSSAEVESTAKRENVFRRSIAYPNIRDTKCLDRHEDFYMNPEMFRPNSPMLNFLDVCVDRYPNKEDPKYFHLKNQVQLFKNFWLWIYDPASNVEQYTQEFAYPLGLETTFCPREHRLTDVNKRLQFVIDKALHSNEAHIALVGPGTRQDPRSKKPNSYDFFIFWYVAHHEIAQLPEPLNQKEQANYITQRWMPWRKSSSAESYLVDPYEKKPKAYPHPALEEMFAYADHHFGKPFTKFG